jgi:hypothetical protein
MSLHPPASASLLLAFVDSLADAAEATIRATARKTAPSARRVKRGSTLRPGPATPMWNEVVTAVRPFIGKRGAKANLARFLGVPRQRVHDYFVRPTACPDAERVLLVLYWLVARRAGKDPS